MKNMIKVALILGVAGLALPAFAKGKSHKAKTMHHCMKDGQEVAGVKSSKACKKEGGKWEKMKAGEAAGSAAAPAGGEAGTTAGGGAATP